MNKTLFTAILIAISNILYSQEVTYLPLDKKALLKISVDTSNVFYISSNVSLAEIYISEKKPELALKCLDKIIRLKKAPNISLIVDNKYTSLKKYKMWHKIEYEIIKKVKLNYPNINIDLAKLFCKIYNEDQTIIDNGTYDQIDSIRNNHLKILDSITLKYGFPSQKLLGEEAIDGMYLILQHTKNRVKQKQYFSIWKPNATYREERLDLAYLEDRILENESGIQKFGTQFILDKNTGHKILVPLINKDSVNFYRKSVGLIPLEDYLKLIE